MGNSPFIGNRTADTGTADVFFQFSRLQSDMEAAIKFMSRKKNKAQAGEELVPCCVIGSQDFFVVGTGSGDDDLFRGDDEGTLCGSAAVEHLLDYSGFVFNAQAASSNAQKKRQKPR